MTTEEVLTPVEYARLAVEVAADKHAEDIVLLDLRGVSDFTDYFVILTAESPRQMETLAEDLEEALEAQHARLHHREGTSQGGWLLLDFGDLIIHLFGPEAREFYQLEQVWSQGSEVVRIH